MNSSSPTRRWYRLLALLLGLALLAAACGDDGGGDGGAAAAPETEGEDEPTSTTEAEDEGEPQPGGSLVYGLEADTATPWTPAKSTCAPSCHMVMRAVYDSLTAYDADGNIVPHLLESFEANEDHTEWTLTPREGVMFHDGTPFDAAAIVANLEAHLASFLTAKSLTPVEGVAVNDDGSAAVVTLNTSWPGFPTYLAGQLGYQASPQWLTAAASDPSLEAQPVGTGPFVFESYEPGGSFVATKNADYWRADEGLPYLDRIEFRVLADGQARKNALLNGDIDMMHTSAGEIIAELREADDIELIESAAYGETSYTLLNVANPDSHLQDVRIRRALAMAVDREVVLERRNGGVGEPANGPFGPDQAGYLEDSGYPEYDPEAAAALVEEYKQEMGIDTVEIPFTTTNDPVNMQTAELLKQFWEQVGFTVPLAQIEQGQFIIAALTGDFEMFAWRNHGGLSPDAQRVWWHSETADEPPGLAVNFGRIRDDVIDENLDTIRGSSDEAETQEAAEAINRQFGEQVYNLWLYRTTWGLAKKPDVNGVDGFELPDGQGETLPPGISGTHPVAQIWRG